MTADHQILSGAQLRLATAVLDVIIPRDGDRPGAGEMGGAQRLDATIAEQPELRRVVLDALQAIDIVTGDRIFASIDSAVRTEILREVESAKPEVFGELVKQTYNIYYTDPSVRRTVGFTPENPQPDGHPQPEPFDTSILEGVRARDRTWRKV